MAFRELFDSGYGKNTDKVESKIHYLKMGTVTVGGEALEFDIGKPPDALTTSPFGQ